MPAIKPFGVEQWMDKYETIATYNLAETCCDSLSISELSSFSPTSLTPLLSATTKLTYSHIRGSPQFRRNVSAFYKVGSDDGFGEENILITPGGIAANFLALYSLIERGDHVICMYPTYQQLYEVPTSLGAEVDLWKCQEDNSWTLALEELRRLMRPNAPGVRGTRLIIINNPNNPIGLTLSTQTLREIAAIARDFGNVPILSDEVYRPLFHSLDGSAPASIIDIYPYSIATSSMSKAFALAGIRVGWVAARQLSVLETIASMRDYNTISVSQLDDAVASYALSKDVVEKVLERNIKLCITNLKILEEFLENHKQMVRYTKPTAGTTLFLKFLGKDGKPIDDKSFCERLIKEKGVMFCPGGYCFGSEFGGYIRIGYACDTQTLKDGLAGLSKFLQEGF